MYGEFEYSIYNNLSSGFGIILLDSVHGMMGGRGLKTTKGVSYARMI